MLQHVCPIYNLPASLLLNLLARMETQNLITKCKKLSIIQKQNAQKTSKIKRQPTNIKEREDFLVLECHVLAPEDLETCDHHEHGIISVPTFPLCVPHAPPIYVDPTEVMPNDPTYSISFVADHS